jgi:hypothetical protein
MNKIMSIFLPVFNWGQAGLVLILVSVLGLITIFSDPLLALYVGIGAYVGMVLNTHMRGLAPDEIEIHEREIGPISKMLNSEPFITPVGDRVWAPSRYKSWLWESDRVSIRENGRGQFRLKGRRRDLRIIITKIRQEGLK